MKLPILDAQVGWVRCLVFLIGGGDSSASSLSGELAYVAEMWRGYLSQSS